MASTTDCLVLYSVLADNTYGTFSRACVTRKGQRAAQVIPCISNVMTHCGDAHNPETSSNNMKSSSIF